MKNADSSVNDGSPAQSLSSVDEDPETTVAYWKDKCLQLEAQLHEVPQSSTTLSLDAEIQCSMLEVEPTNQIEQPVDTSIVEKLTHENEQLANDLSLLKEDVNNLSFQLSSASMQRSTSVDVSVTLGRVILDLLICLSSRK